MAEAKFYVYVHRRADSGEVFYVGKGKGQRAQCVKRRGAYWDRVVAKHGLTIEILERFEHEREAFERECELIAAYRTAGVELVNLTDGGATARAERNEALRRFEGCRRPAKGNVSARSAALKRAQRCANQRSAGE